MHCLPFNIITVIKIVHDCRDEYSKYKNVMKKYQFVTLGLIAFIIARIRYNL